MVECGQVARGRETKNKCEILVAEYKTLVSAGSCCLSLPDITAPCVGGMLIGYVNTTDESTGSGNGVLPYTKNSLSCGVKLFVVLRILLVWMFEEYVVWLPA